MADERIEEELAHLRKTSDELSAEVAAQAARLATLERRVQLLLERAAEAEAAGGGVAVFQDDKPPHY